MCFGGRSLYRAACCLLDGAGYMLSMLRCVPSAVLLGVCCVLCAVKRFMLFVVYCLLLVVCCVRCVV